MQNGFLNSKSKLELNSRQIGFLYRSILKWSSTFKMELVYFFLLHIIKISRGNFFKT
jgi:hypothetical protein